MEITSLSSLGNTSKPFGTFVRSTMTMRYILPLAILLGSAACNTSDSDAKGDPTNGSTTTNTTTAQQTSASTNERDAWQKPQEVFFLMGNDLRGSTIADLAANDGYFTFKMIEMGANVIAIDDDPAALAAIEARKKELGLGDDRLRTRLSPLGDPGLAPEEVDACLLVHSYVRIPNKKDYLTKVFQGTRLPRPLFILEWLNSDTPMGPPLTDRISSERIMDDIGTAGYTDVGTYSAKIPYQAFIFASYQVGDENEPQLTEEEFRKLQQQ